jgi:hypothetical protein
LRVAQIGIYILPEEFAEFRRLAPGDAHFAVPYLEWHRLHNATPHQVTVRVGEFRAYCVQIGEQPSFHALAAFAAKIARDEQAGSGKR